MRIAIISLTSLLLATACGPDTSLCRKYSRCGGADNDETSECMADNRDARAEAKDAGCKSEYNDYMKCLDDASYCEDGDLILEDACLNDMIDYGSCVAF